MANNIESLRLAKRQLRKTIQNTLKSLSEEEVSRQSSLVHERLLASNEYQSARNISVFLSMPRGEISTEKIVKDALSKGKKVFVPYIYNDKSASPNSVMDMVSLHSESDYNSLGPDQWGIPTPDKSSVKARARCLCPSFEVTGSGEISATGEAPLETLDLIVVPGVAFDKERRRLGHGKGYYDNFFSKYYERLKKLDSGVSKMPYLVGIALNEQMLSQGIVPTDDSDWNIDAIIGGDIQIP